MNALASLHESLRKQSWRLPPLLLLAFVFVAGCYAIRVSMVRVYVGDLSPSRNWFICYTYLDEGRDLPIIATEIRDLRTGGLVHTIPNTRSTRGGTLHWSADGERIVGRCTASDASHQIVEFKVSSAAVQCLRRETIDAEDVQTVFANAEGSIVHVENHGGGSDSQRPCLRIVRGADEVTVLQYGRDEAAYAWPALGGAILNVTIRPRANPSPDADYVYTDGGHTSLLQLDASTGSTLHSVRGTSYIPVQNSDTHIALLDPNGVASIVEIGDQENVIHRFKSKTNFSLINQGRLAAWNWDAPRSISVYAIGGPKERSIPLESMASVHPSGDGNLLVTTDAGTLLKLDTQTGATRQLMNRQRWSRVSRWIAILGLPVVCVIWMSLAWKRRSVSPAFEMGFVYVAVTVVLMAWSRQSSTAVAPSMLAAAVFVLLATLMPLVLIWTLSLESLWKWGLPVSTVGIAGVLLAFAFWDNSNVVAEFVFAGGLLVFWQVTGIFALRLRYGPLVRRNVAHPLSNRKAAQIKLKEVVVATAAFAILFSSMRIAGWSNLELRPVFLNWLVTFTLVFSSAVLLAFWSAFRIKRLSLAIVVCFVVSTLLLVPHGYLAMRWPPISPGFHTAQWYVTAFFATGLLFIALRYSHAHSYTFAGCATAEGSLAAESGV